MLLRLNTSRKIGTFTGMSSLLECRGGNTSAYQD